MQTLLGIRLPGPVSVAMLGEMGISAGTRKAAPSLSWHFASHRGLNRVAFLGGKSCQLATVVAVLSLLILLVHFTCL